MSKAAPYTRETIARIRQMAGANTSGQIALELGWDRSLVESVASRHRIEVVGAKPVSPKEPQRQPTIPINRDDVFLGDIKWSPLLCEVERKGVLVYLPPYQNNVFGVLLRSLILQPDDFLDGHSLAVRAGLLSPVNSMILHVRRRIDALHVSIESGPNRRGYRLSVNPWPVKPAHPMPAERMA